MASSTKPKKAKDQILVWPSSLLSPHPPLLAGFAVGWNDESSATCDTVVVAGVIPVLESSDVTKDFKRISQKIQDLRESHCGCCTCGSCDSSSLHSGKNTNGNIVVHDEALSSICDGCVRSVCLKELQLVAFCSPGGSSVVPIAAAANNLPVIVLSSSLEESSWPWWTTADSTLGTEINRQIVIFEDVGRHDTPCLYVGGGFRDHFLIRLAHSTCVIRLLNSKGGGRGGGVEEEVHGTCIESGWNTKVGKPHSQSLTSLVRRSLLLQRLGNRRSLLDLLAFRWRKSPIQCGIAGKSPLTCSKCHLYRFLPQSLYTIAERKRMSADQLLGATVDAGLGLLLGCCLVLLWKRIKGVEGIHNATAQHFATIRRGVVWLGDYPAGFKLNERLTQRMGEAITVYLAIHERLLWHLVTLVESSGLVRPWLVPMIGVWFGASGLLALLVDLGQLGTVHLVLLTAFYRWLYRIELHLLASLWCLFRGKKKNVLRQRIDTMEYDSTQLLLGTIVFAICLLLLTTIFVYHCFFAALVLGVDVVMLLPLLLSYQLLERAPWGALYLRATTRFCLTDATLLLPALSATTKSPDGVDVTYLVASDRGYASIAAEAWSSPLRLAAVHACVALGGLVTGRPHPAPVSAFDDHRG